MTTVSQGSSAIVDIAIGQKLSVSTAGEAYVDIVAGPTGAGYTSKRVTAGAQTFGPYGMATRVNVRAISGSVTYGGATDLVAAQISYDALGNVLGIQGAGGAIIPVPASASGHDDSVNHRWVAGDGSAVQTLAASGSFVSQIVDARNFRMSDATLQVITAGSGTVKVAVSGSVDGVSGFVTLPDQLTGLAAGSAMLQLRAAAMQEWPFYKFTFTETGGASSATVKAIIYAQDLTANTIAADGYVSRIVLGDESIGVPVALSTAIDSAPCDMRFIRREVSSIRVKITGTGTAKLTVAGSMDGMTSWYSLGDRITGMVAGTYALALNDANLAYFPFYRLTITETGGTAAVVATVSVVGRQPLARSSRPRVLLLGSNAWFQSTEWTGNYDEAYRAAIAMLNKLGYEVDLRAVDNTPSTFLDSIGRVYSFIYIPHLRGSGWTTWNSGAGSAIGRILKGQCPIPVFITGVDQSANVAVLAAVGANTRDAGSYRKVLWRGKRWYMSCGSYTVTQQAHMTNLSTLMTDSTATGAAAWRFKGANGWVYVSAGAAYNGDNMPLPMLLTEAVDAAHIAAPAKKLRIVLDIDDMPDCGGGGGNGTQTVADLERVYAAQQKLNMPCSWGIRSEDIVGGRMGQPLLNFITAHTADKGGLLYPVAHCGNWAWSGVNKATKVANFASDVATITAAGIRIGSANQFDAWGYTYFNNNAFDEETLQLATAEAGYWASADNLTSKSGYGWKVVRSAPIGGLNLTPIGGNDLGCFGKTWHRGIRVVGSFSNIASTTKSLDPDDGAAGTTAMAIQCERLFSRSAAFDAPFYIHGSNCYDGHDGGNAPGTVWLEILADVYAAGLSGIMEFVHGAELAKP